MGRRGVGIYLMKNHEGYHDLTAGKAIRRARRESSVAAERRRLTCYKKMDILKW